VDETGHIDSVQRKHASAWHDEAAGTWLIRLGSTAYAFGLADEGTALRHLYWGADAGDMPALRDSDPAERALTWSDETPDEYLPWTSARYDEPSLKVDYVDGTRVTEWRYSGQRIIRDAGHVTVEVDFTDEPYGLRVTLFYRAHDGFDVLERWAQISATTQPVTLRQAYSANWWLAGPGQRGVSGRPGGQSWRLRYLRGNWGAETELTESALNVPKVVLESRRGTTSHQLNPWFCVHRDATETAGEVWSGALAWSGSWKLVVETTATGHLHVTGGINDFDWAYRLEPGEELTLPAFAALRVTGGFGAASREWHAWQRTHVLGRSGRPRVTSVTTRPATPSPVPAAPPPRPVLYNSWEATAFDVSEAGQAQLAELAAHIGAELFVVDDGWFPARHHDQAGLGDWRPDPAKFPRGFGPLIDKVHGLGMRFGLWVEPEMVNPDSDLYRAHPDWVHHVPGRTRTQWRNQLMLNLARREVAEWTYATLDRLLTENDISFLKWDCNRAVTQPGNPSDTTEHVRSLYAILDALRSAHPGVDVETCAGGGGRVDLGILARTDQAWTSDNTDALDRITIQEGFSQIYPAQAMMAWVTDSPNPITGRRLPLEFRFHVAMAGALGIGGDLTRWTGAEMTQAAGLVALYKEIRTVVQHGDLYRLASLRTELVAGVQYLASDRNEAVVLAWWPPRPYGTRPPRLRLGGLAPGASYIGVATGAVYSGNELAHDGIELPVGQPADFGSVLLRFNRVS
jgi:alpha-galactosidase